MSKPPIQSTTQVDERAIKLGSFFIETITTGMYEDSFHCIREYVQNAFDAIRDAEGSHVLKAGDGRIVISTAGTSARPSLSVRDNGMGIDAASAVGALVSVGMSRKRANQHAGFRGIGRLAGIAYCTTLRFTTSAFGESEATRVEFDCGKLRGFLTPGADPRDVRDVIKRSVTWGTAPESEGKHFMEVEMIGLTGLGLEFVKPEALNPYLCQVCPVEYADSFEFADRIRQLGAGFGEPIPVVDVAVRHRMERKAVLKRYRNSNVAGKNKTSQLQNIEPISSKELGWFGWVGISNFAGEVADGTVAGVRFRLKNIQVGDAGLIEDIAEGLTASGTDRRLMPWAVGEVFITNPKVVPNARRDGFEDNSAWRDIRRDIMERVARRITTLIREASESRTAVKSIGNKVDELTQRLRGSRLSGPAAIRVEKDIIKQIAKLDPDKMTGADPKEVNALVSRLKGLRESLPALLPEPTSVPPPTPRPPAPTRLGEASTPKTLIEVVEDVLTEELGMTEAIRLIGLIEQRAGI